MGLNGYLLLGDSQLQRFARFYSLNDQFCFSGCPISDLKKKLKSSVVPKKVVLLIGSNDLKRRPSLTNLTKDYNSLVKFLLRNCDSLVLIACPVIPRKVDDAGHWKALNHLNDLVYSFKNNPKIVIVNLETHSRNQLVKPHFFEDFFYNGKVDRLHLNRNAFQHLYSLLEAVCVG